VSAATTTAWIGLGSNLGDRRLHVERALRELERLGRVAASSIHETEPVGGPPGQPRFLNAVARLDTPLALRALFDALQSIERSHGRDRNAEIANGPRTLDLDLLLFGDARRDDPELRVPHPRFEDRLFVLLPMCELAPDLRLPRSRVSVAERVDALSSRERSASHSIASDGPRRERTERA
jgi:2-amino-4-hydroxy-6-hydroxymethyldihydropteridine diphosphokinase